MKTLLKYMRCAEYYTGMTISWAIVLVLAAPFHVIGLGFSFVAANLHDSVCHLRRYDFKADKYTFKPPSSIAPSTRRRRERKIK